ncbi:MAG: CDP-diacylglycerol--glycerol-3-phosphate 3-phosphatidyltransferase [Treponema sp. CETP13]|nr:MAG: CDP-diacylglycerol--glycerol-3-phosphate 3-phosphatidyltransferase [Treponema sp. CETP13]
MKTANAYSFSRIIIAPLYFILYFLPQWLGMINPDLVHPFNLISVCIMIPLIGFAEFTDYLDGHYARKNNEVSDFGKLFDPFCDVILHMIAFVCYMQSGYMPAIIFVFIFIREYGMLFIRLMAIKNGVTIAARKGGKLKTVIYIFSGMYSLLLESASRLGFASSWNLDLLKTIGVGFYILCLVLCYVSFIDYLKNFGAIVKKTL